MATLTIAVVVVAACGPHASKAHSSAANLGRALPARLPPTSGKNTFYVDGSRGSDRNRGSRRAPWKTITRALATVPLSGSVVKVMPGTYESDGSRYAIVFNRKGDVHDPVTLEPATPGTVTIANGDPEHSTLGAWVAAASGFRIRGLRFSTMTRHGSNVGASGILIENSDRIEIVGCTFNQVSQIGIMVRGGASTPSEDDWVIDNVFRPTGTQPTRQVTGLGFDADEYFGSKGSHWIYAGQYGNNNTWERTSGSRRLVVANNLFVGSTAGRDIELGPQARNSYVIDNTIYGNRAADAIGAGTRAVYAGQAVELFSNTNTPQYTNGFNTVANNLFVNLDGQAVAGSGSTEPGNIVLHNLFWRVARNKDSGEQGFAPGNGTSRIFSVGRGNRQRDPRFADESAYNFHLLRGSPALHAAAPQFSYPYDADGRPRPATPAIGAFELECRSYRPSRGQPGGSSC